MIIFTHFIEIKFLFFIVFLSTILLGNRKLNYFFCSSINFNINYIIKVNLETYFYKNFYVKLFIFKIHFNKFINYFKLFISKTKMSDSNFPEHKKYTSYIMDKFGNVREKI